MGLFGGSDGSSQYKAARKEAKATYAAQEGMLSPWTQAEQSGLSRFLGETQAGGRLDPMRQYQMQDYYASPEYQIYQDAQKASMQQLTDQMQAMGAAGQYGGFGGGTFANALGQNIGQLYAQYGPQALAASRQAWEGQRANAFNQLYGMGSPTQTGQLAQYRGNMGNTIANAYIGQAQAAQQASSAGMGMFGQLASGALMAGGMMGASALAPAAPVASDRRVKTDIKKIADDSRGFSWYEFSYIWDKAKKHIGVMADEVEKIIPLAVVKTDAFDLVDYALIGERQ